MYTTTTIKPAPSCHVPGIPSEPIYVGEYSFNTGHPSQLGAIDYLLFIVAVMIPTMLGIFQAWQHRNCLGLDYFMLAGQSMPAFPVALSMASSYFSAVSFMGISEHIYRTSIMYIIDVIPICIGTSISAAIYMPTLYQLNLDSSFEYLEKRFDKRVRLAAASVFILHMFIFLSLMLYAPALALKTVSGLGMTGSLLSTGFFCIAYVTLGGMRTVIWTESFQAVSVFIGLVVMAVQALSVTGVGLDVWTSIERSGRLLKAQSFNLDPRNNHSVWAILIGSSCLWVGYLGINQTQVFKLQTCRSVVTADLAVKLTVPVNCVYHLLCCCIAIPMLAFYADCDPVKAGFVKDSIQIPVLFAADILGLKSLATIYLTSLCLCAITSFASGLNSVAYVIMSDFVHPLTKGVVSEGTTHRVVQFICLVVGTACLEISFLVAKTEEDLFVTTGVIHGSLTMPVIAVFSIGLFLPHTNQKGAICGLIASLFLSFVFLLQRYTVKLPHVSSVVTCVSNCNISAFSNTSSLFVNKLNTQQQQQTSLDDYNYFATLTWLYKLPMIGVVCFPVGIFVSYLTGFNNPLDVDSRLIVPVVDVLFPLYYLPEHIRDILRFGIDHTDKWSKTTAAPPVVSRFYSTRNTNSDTDSWRFEPSPSETTGITLNTLSHVDAISDYFCDEGSNVDMSSSVSVKSRQTGPLRKF